MVYESKYPTKERKNFYIFMETHKKHGVVGTKAVKNYISSHGFNAVGLGSSQASKKKMYWANIKKGNKIIAEVGIRKNKQIVHWAVH